MIVVLRPFKNVEHFKPRTLGMSHFDNVQDESGTFERVMKKMQERNQTKRLFIGELDSKLFVRSDESIQMMLLKETTRNRSKIFHVCDAYDIASIRAQI